MSMIFSIILPLYKQSQQIQLIVNEYEKALKKEKYTYELLLVVNGEDKASYSIAKNLAKNNSHIKTIYLKRAGWGNAVRAGIRMSRGTSICYTNSARTRVYDLISMLRLAENNSRTVLKATRIMRVGFLRKLGSTLYNIECRLLLKVPVWDINGTPKIIPRTVMQKISLESNDDLLDAELIAKCIWSEVPILEVPVLFPQRFGGTSTTNFVSALRMYIGVFRIKKMFYQGKE